MMAVVAMAGMAATAAMVAVKAGVVMAEGAERAEGAVAAVEAREVAVKAPETAARPQKLHLCSQLSSQALSRAQALRRS